MVTKKKVVTEPTPEPQPEQPPSEPVDEIKPIETTSSTSGEGVWIKETVEQTIPLEDILLAEYQNAPSGPMDIKALAAKLGVSEERLNQAWDRLYDYGKVSFSKFMKP